MILASETSFCTGAAPGETVGQPGRVAHQILDRHRPPGGDEIEPVAVHDADLHVGEGGDEFGDGVGDHQPPLLDQRHRRRGHDRLGHGIDTKDGVERHGRPARAQGADGLREADLAVPRDQHRDAGGATRPDLTFKSRREALQPRPGKADLLGPRCRQTGDGGRKRVEHGGIRARVSD